MQKGVFLCFFIRKTGPLLQQKPGFRSAYVHFGSETHQQWESSNQGRTLQIQAGPDSNRDKEDSGNYQRHCTAANQLFTL